jgi:hypothetical protein
MEEPYTAHCTEFYYFSSVMNYFEMFPVDDAINKLIIGTMRRQEEWGGREICGLQHNLARRVKQKGQSRNVSELTPTN